MTVENIIMSLVIEYRQAELGIFAILACIALSFNLPRILVYVFNKEDSVYGLWEKVIDRMSLIGIIIFPISEAVIFSLLALAYTTGLLIIAMGIVK